MEMTFLKQALLKNPQQEDSNGLMMSLEGVHIRVYIEGLIMTLDVR
jgi:hypothetical protein